MALGQTLKALRQKQGLNQKSLSALSGVSQATISRVETGRVRQLRSAALKNLADALGVSVDFLMGDSEVFADIPVQQSQEAAPGVREDRFRHIADTLQPFALHDAQRFLYVNQSLAGLLGHRADEFMSKPFIDMMVSPQSRPLFERMIASSSNDPYEVLLVRRDGTVLPAEIQTRDITDTARLTLVRDCTQDRIRQAAERLHRLGLEVETLTDMERIVRSIADELEDMGIQFAAVGINLIDEDADRLSSYTVLSMGQGGTYGHDRVSLRQTLEKHSSLRGLVSHWRRGEVWQRPADEDFFNLVLQHSGLTPYQPQLVIDVPFVQGTLAVGLLPEQMVRNQDLVELLHRVGQPLAAILKRLLQVETLLGQLRDAHLQLQGDSADGEANDEAAVGLLADADALALCRQYRGLSAEERDLVRSFVARLGRPPQMSASA